MMIIDQLGRTFKNLRISLLDTCNFACIYCTDEDFTTHQIAKNQLSVIDLLKTVAKLNQKLDLKSVRLTGGEPLLYQDLEKVITGLVEIGIPDIKMTSNGFLLAKKAEGLKQAGLKEINISLDAVDEASFFKITRRDKFNEVDNGIDAALNAGLKVKLNAVIMKGKNDDQIIPLLQYSKSKNLTIRFLEVMEMGHLHQQKENFLFSEEEILHQIAQHFEFKSIPRKASATANYWETSCGTKFGIIANTSTPFCSDCDRLRLDHQGNIYGCLSVNEPISIHHLFTDVDLEDSLQQALEQKQSLSFTGSNLSMMEIGG
jgi:cyclic pyranopterin phosphate synthase